MRRFGRWVRYAAVAAGMLAAVVLLMMWLFGAFVAKVPPQSGQTATLGRPIREANLAEARLIKVPLVETAVGTIRPIYESAVASKILEKVTEVLVRAGQPVKKDDVLVRLDDSVLQSRVQQSQSAVDAAQAAFAKAQDNYDRIKAAFGRQVATRMEMDDATTSLQSAQAHLQQSKQSLDEAKTVLMYTTVRSPLDGIVTEKKVNQGDTVSPGQTLVVLYDPTRMQLVASVRESLTQHLKVGQELGVFIEALKQECTGRVSEIVPESESASRSFQVKVTGPCHPGVYAGMFGRLTIPLGSQEVLVVPRSAITRVGQIDMVEAAQDSRLYRRAVLLGRSFGDDVEVLSGLSPGEKVAVGNREAPANG